MNYLLRQSLRIVTTCALAAGWSLVPANAVAANPRPDQLEARIIDLVSSEGDADARVADAIAFLSEDPPEGAQRFLPNATSLDSVDWVDGVYHVALSFPAGTADVFLDDGEADAISAALSRVASGRPDYREIGRASVGKECRSRWSPDH